MSMLRDTSKASRPLATWIRPLLLLAIGQIVCIIFGLWLHDRILISAGKWPAGRQSAAQSDTPAASDNPTDAETMIAQMPLVGAIAVFWIGGLQTLMAYMVLSRIFHEQGQRRSKTDEETHRRTRDLTRTRDAIIFGLAKLTESRDPDTGHHVERISIYSIQLATALKRHPKFRGVVTPAYVRSIGISSVLHDIGKVGVEDSILLKRGPLTKEERSRMQRHTVLGADCLLKMEQRLGTSNFLQMAREIALHHHERWDGNGYPSNLKGEEIPLAARIVAIVDVYDALSVRRVYKEPYDRQTCADYIKEQSGTQFDPDLVKVFESLEPEFYRISRQYVDTGVHSQHVRRVDVDRPLGVFGRDGQESSATTLLLPQTSEPVTKAVGGD